MVEPVTMNTHPMFVLALAAIFGAIVASLFAVLLRARKESQRTLYSGLGSIICMTALMMKLAYNHMTWLETKAVVMRSEQLCNHTRGSYRKCDTADSRLAHAWLAEVKFRDANQEYRIAQLTLDDRDIDFRLIQAITPGRAITIAYSPNNPEKLIDTAIGFRAEVKTFLIGYAAFSIIVLVYSAGLSSRLKDNGK